LPTDAAANPAISLDSAACTGPPTCVAVGHYTDSSGNQEALMVTGYGSSWTSTTPPPPANAVSVPAPFGPNIASIACLSSAGCIAVGTYKTYYSTVNGYHEKGMLLVGLG
jgi:hypothetical protein